MESVEKWLKDNFEKNYYDNSLGDDGGSGYGYGVGIGKGFYAGGGEGMRVDNGIGIGLGYGAGDGAGCGESDGKGEGKGRDVGIKSFKGRDIYVIDGVQTIIEHIKEAFAKGYIINSDFSLEVCYVAKGQGHFAHGKNLKEARNALDEKVMRGRSVAEIVEKFLDVFELDKLYPGTDFFKWHHYLTGSCLMGREAFVKDKGLDVNALYTVDEFIFICENSYGKDVIQLLKKKYAMMREKNKKGEHLC